MADYVTVEGSGDMIKISQVLHENCMDLFVPIKPPEENLGEDTITWLLTSSGEFTIKSACEAQVTQGSDKRIFQQIWKTQAPQRVRSFLWLMASDALLTNENRTRRHLTHSAICSICGDHVETMLHVTRDCFVVRNTWMSIDPSLVQSDFFHQNLRIGWELIFLLKLITSTGFLGPSFLPLIATCCGVNVISAFFRERKQTLRSFIIESFGMLEIIIGLKA